ncbi:MAG: type II toxin-antitoxin system HipA family toxin [Burkholderiaceae bacterium]|nr:type II toxin-antitoxin system HipA family toxin [Burkholderiaceae bacterium]
MAALARLQVLYRGWGESWPLGTIAHAGGRLLFEYSPEAIARGLQLSPIRVPLPLGGSAPASYSGPAHFHGLPGFIADSLPDGWGMLLMDRALRRCGRDPAQVSVLERLAIVGHGGIGALVFEPADTMEETRADIEGIAALAREMQSVASDSGEHASGEQLRRLLVLGGSPQGARPKALLRWNQVGNVFAQDHAGAAGGEPWLVKFPGYGEHAEVCALEEFYARLARRGGIEMMPTRYFGLGKVHSAFGTRRFDRHAMANGNEVRVPVASLSALLDADHRLPALDYTSLLLATTRLTGDYRETLNAFERCVFNVLTHNRDDHTRNFAFCMDAEGRWKLSPAFDLSFSHGPGGEHSTSVAGEGRAPGRRELMRAALEGGVRQGDAEDCIAKWLDALQPDARLIEDLPVRQKTWSELRKSLTGVWSKL